MAKSFLMADSVYCGGPRVLPQPRSFGVDVVVVAITTDGPLDCISTAAKVSALIKTFSDSHR